MRQKNEHAISIARETEFDELSSQHRHCMGTTTADFKIILATLVTRDTTLKWFLSLTS